MYVHTNDWPADLSTCTRGSHNIIRSHWNSEAQTCCWIHSEFHFSIMTTPAPKRFACNDTLPKQDAQKTLQQDGSIILTGLERTSSSSLSLSSWSELASWVPRHVWTASELRLSNHRADAVHIEHEALKLQGEALPPHSDGYIWGDCYPDLVILVCETPADDHGGANYLIDGHAVLNRLSESCRNLLEHELVDHTERGENGFATGAESVVPVIRYLDAKGWRSHWKEGPTKHLCWRRMVSKNGTEMRSNARNGEEPYISIWATAPGTADGKTSDILAALWELDRSIAAEENRAPRFVLKEGEALIVDNFRMLHARDAFHGSENKRRMWRVWSWTNASFGLPPQVHASGGQDVPSNILQAEKAIQAKT